MSTCTRHQGVRVEWTVCSRVVAMDPSYAECPVCVLGGNKDLRLADPRWPEDGVCSHNEGATLVYCERGVPCPLCACYDLALHRRQAMKDSREKWLREIYEFGWSVGLNDWSGLGLSHAPQPNDPEGVAAMQAGYDRARVVIEEREALFKAWFESMFDPKAIITKDRESMEAALDRIRKEG